MKTAVVVTRVDAAIVALVVVAALAGAALLSEVETPHVAVVAGSWLMRHAAGTAFRWAGEAGWMVEW